MNRNANILKTVVIIPALNEEDSIAKVIEHIPAEYRTHIIVADNGSSDETVQIARGCGAVIAHASQRGYGSACLAGIKEAKKTSPDLYIFLDGDFSDYPEDMTAMVAHLLTNDLDLVIGSRSLGLAEEGSMLPQAVFGNWLSTTLMAWRYGYRFTDLGPFRVIRAKSLEQIQMRDPNFGWTMEMQVKALKYGLKVGEVPVRYRKRIGKSKITGTVKGTILAGVKILWTLAKYSLPHEDAKTSQQATQTLE
ncbi:MAG: glycosyltransferase family 2 protein [Bacteriovoracia bacterium]